MIEWGDSNVLNLKLNAMASATALALVGMSCIDNTQAANATPYPPVPLIWQSGTSSIKPNILLFLDTSGSMSTRNGGSTRLQVAKNAITDVIAGSREQNRWGLATFVSGGPNLTGGDARGGKNIEATLSWISAGGEIQINVDDVSEGTPAGAAHYNALINKINGLPANTNTPIASSYYELVRYYRGMRPGFGNLRVPGGRSSYTSPIQFRCQKNHIIYISDGEPTGHANRYQLGELYHNDAMLASLKKSIWDAGNRNSGVTEQIAAFAHDNDLIKGGTDVEGKSFDDPAFATQNIITYTIGFAANVEVLNQMATRGGGRYFQANNAATLKQVLLSSLAGIQRDSGYTPATAGVTTNSVGNTAGVANTTLNPSSWTSELRFYQYNSAAGTFDLSTFTTPKYITGSRLTSQALFSTTNGVVAVTPGSVPGSMNNALFGISPARTDTPTSNDLLIPITKSSNNNEYKNLLRWLLRWDGSDTVSGTRYRDRNRGDTNALARYMGDVSGNMAMFGDVKVAAASAADFNRREFIAVPSNDGMLHILQANQGSDRNNYPYVEALQYVPGTAQRDTANDTIIRNLVFTAETSYGDLRNPKQNFIDGDLLQVSTREGEHTIVNGMGSGARGAYALMVGGKDQNNNAVGINRPSGTWASSVPLWDTSSNRFGGANGVYNRIGYNFGSPKIGYVAVESGGWTNNVRMAVLLSSGMDDPNRQTPRLLILDHLAKNYAPGKNHASTGAAGHLIAEIPIGRNYTATTTAQNSVASIIQAHDGLTSAQGIDINGDNLVDLVYAGDYKGNIWRFDLRGSTPASWGARMVYQGTGVQPLVAEPNLMYWPDGVVGVYFGTGSNLYQGDLSAHAQQSLYGVFDHVNACALNAPNAGKCAVTTQGDLLQQELSSTEISGVTSYYISSNHPYANIEERKGFYLNLPGDQFRVIKTPEVVKVARRSAAGVIWNVERIVGSAAASSAALTCTPEATSTSGFRLIVDADRGIASPYITWTGAKKTATNHTISSIPYAGSSSRSVLLSNNPSVFNNRGILGSGTLPPPGSSEPPNDDGCVGKGKLASTTSSGGTVLNEIDCVSTQGVRRLSWREIF